MPPDLHVSLGQYSDRGRKEVNQDFHGAIIPARPLLTTKGIAVVLADGISSSNVSQVASESAVKSFLTDYYCTPDSWSVKTSAHRVLAAANSWLHAQTIRSPYSHDKDRGYICTLSAIVLKSRTAHIFHVGDARVYRLSGQALEQMTDDHRISVSSQQTYLSRALGVQPSVEIDYRAISMEASDIFVLATDGVYEHVAPRFIVETLRIATDLDAAARRIADEAQDRGSPDNLTVQIVRIDSLPDGDADDVLRQVSGLPLPPLLEASTTFDGYRIVREIHASSRSHIYLATDPADDALIALKIPSIDLRDDPGYLRRFMMEEWIARRIDNPHVLKSRPATRKRGYLYVVSDYVEGQTLAQWMIDNPKPDLETVRQIVEQIAKGLRAFHRMEMLHQDLRPENIMIERNGMVKIIDFGSTTVAGVVEAAPAADAGAILGTQQYTAPEYFQGAPGTPSSDLFSLGVITYQMLTGKLPYGAQIAQARTAAHFRKLLYRSASDLNRDVPAWIDGALRRAVHPNPLKRHEALSEFLFDLRHPNARYIGASSTPLIERNPLLFWKALCALLAGTIITLLARQKGLF